MFAILLRSIDDAIGIHGRKKSSAPRDPSKPRNDWKKQAIEQRASCSGAQNSSEKQDNTVRVWNISSGMQILLLRFHTATIHSVTWHPETQVLATASRDRIVGVHTLGRELITSSKSLRGHTDYVNAVAWSPCGTALASASSDRSVRIWHSSSGEILQVQALCSF